MSFFLSWIKNYVKNPLELGAILPTYKFAANLMTKNIISNEKTGLVVGSGRSSRPRTDEEAGDDEK